MNEETRLRKCLKALSFVDEIIVVDSGSVDATRKIARSMKARIFIRKFDNFINQKNHAISRATKEWVLFVDADEIVSPTLRDNILTIVRNPEDAGTTQFTAYRIPRISFYLGRWIRHCGWYPEYKIRLFRRNQAKYHGAKVHEILIPTGPIGYLKGNLEHYSYSDISDHLSRINKYSTLIATDKYKRGKKSTPLWAIAKSISKFFITFIYHRGFLDGRAGLLISVLAAYYNFLKYIKLWELNRGDSIKKPNTKSRP